jgi:hypothetical protein
VGEYCVRISDGASERIGEGLLEAILLLKACENNAMRYYGTALELT